MSLLDAFLASEVFLALRWYVVVQIFAFAALPLALQLFRHLPDRGYGMAKPLGLLLTGWLFWLLATLGWLRNTAGGVCVALLLLLAAGAIVHGGGRGPDRVDEAAGHLDWRLVFITEMVFGTAFAAWCLVRAHMPHIETSGGEKWMEIAFLNAILRSESFPPHDPWLSGFAISYYHFGYILMAMLVRLSSVSSSIGFNLGIATLFAMTCCGSFSLACNLIAARRRREAVQGTAALPVSALQGGLLGPLLVAVMGNLEGVLEMLHSRGYGPASFWRWLDIRSINGPAVPRDVGTWMPQRFFWWWQASRVLHDYAPWGSDQEVIDEFPVFSFILGDMHPHVLALPFVLLALALALNLYLRVSAAPRAWRTGLSGLAAVLPAFPLRCWELLVYAVCLGGLGFLNTWDLPIYLFVVVAAFCIAYPVDEQRARAPGFYVLGFAVLFLPLVVLGLGLYLPFWLSFQSQAGGVLPNLFNGTRLSQFLVMFGPFPLILGAFVVVRARRAGISAGVVAKGAAAGLGGFLATSVFVLLLVLVLVRSGALSSPGGELSYVDSWLRGEPIPGIEDPLPTVGELLRNRLLLDPDLVQPSSDIPAWQIVARSLLVSPVWTMAGLAASISAILLILTRVRGNHSRGREPQGNVDPDDFVLLLLAVGVLLVLSVEFIYLKDNFLTRMNTVFKFYYQAWVLWALASAYALTSLVRQRRVGLVVLAVGLIITGLVYPALAIPGRAREQGASPTLDGTAYLAQIVPDDYEAIEWLNGQVQGAPVILEAPGEGYQYEGRVSALTGLPTVLGWAGHEAQWRGSYEEQGRRKPDIESIYVTRDVGQALTLLDKYGISCVYVGDVERARYPADGLAKFASFMDVVYSFGSVTIYRR